MKIGELYMIEYKGGEEALENMWNGGLITFKQLLKMKVPSPGVLLGFKDDSLSQEARAVLEARLKEMNVKASKRKQMPGFYLRRDAFAKKLEKQSNPQQYGIFMYDGEIQCKIKLSDVILTKV